MGEAAFWGGGGSDLVTTMVKEAGRRVRGGPAVGYSVDVSCVCG